MLIQLSEESFRKDTYSVKYKQRKEFEDLNECTAQPILIYPHKTYNKKFILLTKFVVFQCSGRQEKLS